MRIRITIEYDPDTTLTNKDVVLDRERTAWLSGEVDFIDIQSLSEESESLASIKWEVIIP